MMILFTSVFVASLLGSLHCVGMCGPFALLAANDPQRRSAAFVPTMAYSFGRLVTYSMIGLLFGALGMAINQSVSFTSWQQTATWVAGGLMIAIGVIALLRHYGVRIQLLSFAPPLQNALQAVFQRTIKMPPLPRAIAIGMLTSLMPCGWLYTFGITAAGTGHPLTGMALMMSFWLGTVPIMSALMLGTNHISHKLQAKIPLAMSVLVIALGVFTLVSRAPVNLSGMQMNDVLVAAPQSGGAPGNGIDTELLTRSVLDIDQEQLPCCCTENNE